MCMAQTILDKAIPSSSMFIFDKATWIGFDMDHTLVKYNIKNLLELTHECCVRYLVDTAKYDKSLLKVPYDHNFLVKGIIVDKELGNFLKLDARRRVIKATHGKIPIDDETILQLYPTPLDFRGLTSKRFWCCTSYFEMAFIHMYAVLVNWIDDRIDSGGTTQLTKPQWYARINRDIFRAVVLSYGSGWEKGHYFPELLKNTAKYIEKGDDTKKFLQNLRNKCKLFLLTNSDWQYVDLLMTFTFGSDWTSLFDLILLSARKPYFWVLDRPFYEVTGGVVGKETVTRLQEGKIYTGGNLKHLNEFFGPKATVIYVGDDLVSDVFVQNYYSKWHTIAIVEELERLEKSQATNHTIRSATQKPQSETYRTDAIAESPTFGSFFFTDDKQATLTYWAYILHHYTSLYLPFVGRLAHLNISEPVKTHKVCPLEGWQQSAHLSMNAVQEPKKLVEENLKLKQLSIVLPFEMDLYRDVNVAVPTAQDMIETQNYIHSSLEEKDDDVEHLHIERS